MVVFATSLLRVFRSSPFIFFLFQTLGLVTPRPDDRGTNTVNILVLASLRMATVDSREQ